MKSTLKVVNMLRVIMQGYLHFFICPQSFWKLPPEPIGIFSLVFGSMSHIIPFCLTIVTHFRDEHVKVSSQSHPQEINFPFIVEMVLAWSNKADVFDNIKDTLSETAIAGRSKDGGWSKTEFW